jgi:hypothetical protein
MLSTDDLDRASTAERRMWVQVDGGVEEAAEGGQATTGQVLHDGAVTALAHCADAALVATGGADGAIGVTSLVDMQSGKAVSRQQRVQDASPSVSVSGLCWIGSGGAGGLASVGTEGVLRLWDIRSSRGGRAVSQSPYSWGKGRDFLGVVGHVGRPQMCVVSDASGASLWDVRTMQQPVAEVAGGDLEGGVVLCFDRWRAGLATAPLVAATGQGRLCEVDMGVGSSVVMLAHEDAGLVAVDVDGTHGETVFACTDCASLSVVHRGTADRLAFGL